jgi:hypothetical protein
VEGGQLVSAIAFPAQIIKVQTLADGGLRVTLDLPETVILEAAKLMECKRQGVAGQVTFEPLTQDKWDGQRDGQAS